MTTPYTTTLKVGEQHALPRVFLAGRYLERAGWLPATPIQLTFAEHTITIARATTSRKAVNPRGKDRLPCIDLNEQELASVLRIGDRVHVRVEAERIVISLAPLAQRIRARLRDGSLGSLFGGVGVADYAGALAGLRSAWTVEIDPRWAEAFAENHPSAHVLNCSIEEAVLQTVLNRGEGPITPVEVLFAGIPCPAFSGLRRTDAAQVKRDAAAGPQDHHTIDLTAWTLAVIALANPRTVICENVSGYAESETAAALLAGLRRLGYHVESREVVGWDFGCLQRRARTAIVAMTPDADGTCPSPWPEVAIPGTQRVRDILDAEVPDDAWVRRSEHPNLWARGEKNAAEGRNFQFTVVDPESTRIPACTAEYGNGRLRQNQPVLAHPTEGADTLRKFTLTEGRRLFGLPDGFAITDGTCTGWEALGQSVLVPLWQWIIAAATGRSAPARPVVSMPAAALTAPPARSVRPGLADLPLFAA